MGIVLVFIVLFSGYLAISINYSKAFKVKNEIITIIEKNEGFTTKTGSQTDNSTEKQIDSYLEKIGYQTATTLNCPEDIYGEGTTARTGGYCIKRIETTQGNYYKVTTFVKIELPLIWNTFTFPVSGETKLIYYDKGIGEI